jgi:hypothetical protein
MHAYGFSTGAIAPGDVERGLRLLRDHAADAVELSALRDFELGTLMSEADGLDLARYRYVSVHAPSKLDGMSERECAELLEPCVQLGWHVVLHPDAIEDSACWDSFGEFLCLENMDKRKRDGRTVEELTPWFERFPSASFCLDLAHAQQVDPSMILTGQLINAFHDRLVQVHLSELNNESSHRPLSLGMVDLLQRFAHRLPPAAIVLESQVQESEIGIELELARRALEVGGSVGVR